MGSAFGSAVGGSHSEAREPGAERLAAIVFAVLVVGSFAAFAITQHLKHTPPVVGNFEMDAGFQPVHKPAARCRRRVPRRLVNSSTRVEYVSFKPAQASLVTVAVVNAAGGEEATLVRNLPVERYKQVSLCWNGQRGGREHSGLAPPGEYRLRVSLASGGHSPVYSPRSFALRAAGR